MKLAKALAVFSLIASGQPIRIEREPSEFPPFVNLCNNFNEIAQQYPKIQLDSRIGAEMVLPQQCKQISSNICAQLTYETKECNVYYLPGPLGAWQMGTVGFFRNGTIEAKESDPSVGCVGVDERSTVHAYPSFNFTCPPYVPADLPAHNQLKFSSEDQIEKEEEIPSARLAP